MLRLLVAYDGTDFSGYAAQPGLRTVQGVLEEALGQIADGQVRVTAAGRTDAGVHALGQVVSLPGVRDLAPADVLRALAGKLPSDVSVLDAAEESGDFDARRSARWRSYTYLLWNADTPHPLFGRFTTWMSRKVDVSVLREAMAVVEGTHDFSSFARVREDQSPQRRVISTGVERDGDLLRVHIAADAFLHQMVRSIVGSALEVAAGKRNLAWMRQALLAQDRSAAGPTAPARGLTLVDVGYENVNWTRRTPVPWPWAGEALSVMQTQGASQ